MFGLDATELARAQFALNISFHILFPAITIGLGWVLLFFKLRFRATKVGADTTVALGRRILGKPQQAADPTQPVVLGPQEHGINPELVSNNAIRVTQTLQQAGFKAFLVGGAVWLVMLLWPGVSVTVREPLKPFRIGAPGKEPSKGAAPQDGEGGAYKVKPEEAATGFTLKPASVIV